MIESGDDWTDVVFVELMKRTESTQRRQFLLFKYPKALITTGTIVSPMTVGGVAGAVFGGVIGGPVGATIGAAVGVLMCLAYRLAIKK